MRRPPLLIEIVPDLDEIVSDLDPAPDVIVIIIILILVTTAHIQ